MNLVLLDPSLTDFSGHFYNYDKSIARSWIKNTGGKCFALSSLKWSTESHDFEIIPTYYYALEQIISGVRFLSHQNLLRLAKKFAEDTITGLAKLDRSQEPFLVFLHTTTPAQILSLKYISERIPGKLKTKFVIMLRYSPEINPLSPAKENIAAYKWVLDQVLSSCVDVVFVTDSTVLSQEYKRLFALEVQILPIPHTFLPMADEKIPKPRTVGMLGPARSTKGIHYYPRLVNSLRKQNNLSVILQSNVLFLRDRDALIAREILKQSQNVRLINQSLTPEQYEVEIRGIDIIALPYQLAYYHSQTSGIMAEAASLGKPCVVPKGTWMHLQMKSNRVAGLAFEPGNLEDFVDQVHSVIANYQEFREKACAFMSEWNKIHNPNNFVELLQKIGGK